VAAHELRLADRSDFESEVGGKKVGLYTLRSDSLVTQITNYGGRIVSLFMPDRDGSVGNVTLGFDRLTDYLTASERYYGAIIGRYANRISGGRFSMDGREHVLSTNDAENHLHGGETGFDSVVWRVVRSDERSLLLAHRSPDGEEGYPGMLDVEVHYVVHDDRLTIRYSATTDAPTIVNLTNHAYFNLAGPGSGSIDGHQFNIEADFYTPIDDGLIPTGEIAAVDATPIDFRQPKSVRRALEADSEQIRRARGIDHNFVLRSDQEGLGLAASAADASSGRRLEVYTTEPGIQFYTGNFFDGSDIGSSGRPHRFREAFALETQHFPDSPNQPNFPPVVLRPGQRYTSRTVYRFTANEVRD
jgi:aldose 1-epimerase